MKKTMIPDLKHRRKKGGFFFIIIPESLPKTKNKKARIDVKDRNKPQAQLLEENS